jgi:hypothetical protein
MITRIGNISQQMLVNGRSGDKREKESPCKLESLKAGEKAKRLMQSIMSDFPEEEEHFTHNFD